MAHTEVDFTYEQAIRTLGVTPEKLDRLIDEGAIRTVPGSVVTLVPRESILAYMATVTTVGKDRKKGAAKEAPAAKAAPAPKADATPAAQAPAAEAPAAEAPAAEAPAAEAATPAEAAAPAEAAGDAEDAAEAKD